jgi:hypothetical protein
LYISAPDAAYGNPYGGGVFPGGRPSENPADVRGKMLRVDISGGDDYPGDTNKNFVIPPDNPIPVWNAANPTNQIMGATTTNGGTTNGLGEVFLVGLRNGYRASIDRGTGDIYWGDVGENTWEEVNFEGRQQCFRPAAGFRLAATRRDEQQPHQRRTAYRHQSVLPQQRSGQLL